MYLRAPSALRYPGVQYGVSQNTTERALALLKDEGLIETSMGRGMFVTWPEDRLG